MQAFATGTPINLARWTGIIAETATPHLTRYTVDGGEDAIKRLRRAVQNHQGHRKAATPPKLVVAGFDLNNPRVQDAIAGAALQFAASTNATSQLGVDEAREELRRNLAESQYRGESHRLLRRRVESIFGDRTRAERIALTEASRFVHGGQLLAAQESGIVKGLKWLTSSNPCPKCAKLNGKVVKLGEPFFIDPKGGAYSVCSHPPLHPH